MRIKWEYLFGGAAVVIEITVLYYQKKSYKVKIVQNIEPPKKEIQILRFFSLINESTVYKRYSQFLISFSYYYWLAVAFSIIGTKIIKLDVGDPAKPDFADFGTLQILAN